MRARATPKLGAMTASGASPSSLPDWQTALDEGRFADALDRARAAVARDTHNLPACRAQALAAFRVGELSECARAAVGAIALQASPATLEPTWDDVLAVSVVAAGELAQFDQALAHLQLMLAMAKREGSLATYVRARGTAASCFALMGDPWAGQRLLAELAGFFMGVPQERALEATVRSNLCSTYLLIAQWARRVGDTPALQDASDHAATNLALCRELGAALQSPRVLAFADVHGAELAILQGRPGEALAVLPAAIAAAQDSGFWAHTRMLRLTQVEAAMDAGQFDLVPDVLQRVAERLNEGHELMSRIRFHRAWQRWQAQQGDSAAALTHADQAWTLLQHRNYLQLQAQSRYLRTRLELEHLYRYRSSRSKGTTSKPGELL